MRLLFKSDYVQDESPEAVYLRVIDLYFFFLFTSIQGLG